MKLRTAINPVCFALLAAAVAGAQTIQVGKDNRSIAITASDSATVDADIATVEIGFIAYGADKDAAYAEGSRVSNGIIKALSDAGIKKDAIESANQSIAALQQYERTSAPAGMMFRVTQGWSVKAAAAEAARVLDIAVKAGANNSGQINWEVKDANALEAQAAGKALARARSIAERMAEGLQIKLGALIYASNQASGSGVRPLLMLKQEAAPAPIPDPVIPLAISPRKVERSATVYAVFAIE